MNPPPLVHLIASSTEYEITTACGTTNRRARIKAGRVTVDPAKVTCPRCGSAILVPA